MTTRPPRSISFISRLASSIEAYLRMKEALGRRYAAERTILRALDRFMATIDDDLTSDTFVAWNATLGRLTSGVRRNWLRVVRNLCLYRRRTIPDVFIPDPTGFPKPHVPIRPYIFTTTDIARLLDAADHLVATSRSPLRREAFRLAIVLLYTSGLRRGELVRLTVGDYDPSEQTLLIRASKFHKSRRLPLSSDAQRELEAYLRSRRHRGFPTAADSALIWNRSRRGGRPYTGEAVRCEIDALYRAADIRTPTGARPRIHDLRQHAGSRIMPGSSTKRCFLRGRSSIWHLPIRHNPAVVFSTARQPRTEKTCWNRTLRSATRSGNLGSSARTRTRSPRIWRRAATLQPRFGHSGNCLGSSMSG
jgi:integrase